MEESKGRQMVRKLSEEELAGVVGGVSISSRPNYRYRCKNCNEMIYSIHAAETCTRCNGPLELEQYFPDGYRPSAVG